MSTNEIAQHLGYSSASPVDDIPDAQNFDLDAVNSYVSVIKHGFNRNYLVVFAHSCPSAKFGGTMDTTATSGRLKANDSIIIGQEYCRIKELYNLN